MIRIHFWGTRGSITAPGVANWYYGGNTACVQLIAYQSGVPGAADDPHNPQLILDGGSGLALLKDSLMHGPCGQGKGEVHILLSHYHWDHIIGLPFFTPLFVKGNRIAFYGASAGDLQASVERLFTSVYSPVKGVQNVAAQLSFHPIDSAGLEVAGFNIQTTETHHPGKTLAFRIQRDSQVVVYSPDHEVGLEAYDSALVKLAQNADLWILNGHYTPGELQDHTGWGHSSHLEAINLAVEANVKTAALFHHNHNHDDKTLDKMVVQAQKAAAGTQMEVLMSRDRMIVDIGSKST